MSFANGLLMTSKRASKCSWLLQMTNGFAHGKCSWLLMANFALLTTMILVNMIQTKFSLLKTLTMFAEFSKFKKTLTMSEEFLQNFSNVDYVCRVFSKVGTKSFTQLLEYCASFKEKHSVLKITWNFENE